MPAPAHASAAACRAKARTRTRSASVVEEEVLAPLWITAAEVGDDAG